MTNSEDTKKYSITTAAWTFNNAPFTGTTFAANARYTKTVTVTANTNYSFTVEDSLEEAPTINGRRVVGADILSRTHDTLQLRHQFQLTEADEYWVSWTALLTPPANAAATQRTISAGNYRVNATSGNVNIATPSTDGMSGLIIAANATVTIYIPANVTLNVNGADGSFTRVRSASRKMLPKKGHASNRKCYPN